MISQAKTVLFLAVVLALLLAAIAVHPALDLVLATTPVVAIGAVFVLFAERRCHALSNPLRNLLARQVPHSSAATTEDLIAVNCAMRC